MSREDDRTLHPDAEELILCEDERYVCETYLFEPTPHESGLGFLLAAAETEDREGIGSELIDTIMTAIQKEYYRDLKRNPETAFEMALHQANLILHDTAEAGIRDWMGYFHIAVACLVGDQLHISVAGSGKVWLARGGQMVNVSAGLGHSPITDALQTFSQIASGDLQEGDTVFLTTAHFESVFHSEDVIRFTLDHNAATISSRLEQLYHDQKQHAPLALVTVSLMPAYVAKPKLVPGQTVPTTLSRRPRAGVSQENIQPRKPLVIRRGALQTVFLGIAQFFVTVWKLLLKYVWPAVKQGSSRGGRAIVSVSKSTGKGMYSLARRRRASGDDETATTPVAKPPRSFKMRIASMLAWLFELPSRTMAMFRSLPKTSKFFALISVVLVAALLTSLVLLQHKRSSDQDIQKASELLHEAQTKKDAAATAMIYDNRDQAHTLLTEAQGLASQLTATGLYQDETKALLADVQTQMDRLQRVTRANGAQVRQIADIASTLSGKPPEHIFLSDGALYTYDPENNSIIKVGLDGNAAIVHQTTQGIGFITDGVVHPSDKTITLATDPTGVAIFDTKDSSVTSQEITLPKSDAEISDLAVFGNRLYVYDKTAGQIFSYNKTLRGYSGGTPWVGDGNFPATTIRSIAVDGNIYTLHTDGSVRRLFKGQTADFTAEHVDPSLNSATEIITNDDLKYLYIVDPANKRVVIMDKKGALVQQVFVDSANSLVDVAVAPDEKTLYALDGTNILEITLTDSTSEDAAQ